MKGSENVKLFFGLAGRIASGKTTVSEYLNKQYDFEILRFRDIIVDALRDKGKEINRENMQKTGREIDELLGPKLFSELLLCRAGGSSNKYVIDSIRHVKIHLALKEMLGNYFLLFVDCDEVRRNLRLRQRDGRDKDLLSLENHPVEQESDHLRKHADHVLINNQELPDLYKKLDEIVRSTM